MRSTWRQRTFKQGQFGDRTIPKENSLSAAPHSCLAVGNPQAGPKPEVRTCPAAWPTALCLRCFRASIPPPPIVSKLLISQGDGPLCHYQHNPKQQAPNLSTKPYILYISPQNLLPTLTHVKYSLFAGVPGLWHVGKHRIEPVFASGLGGYTRRGDMQNPKLSSLNPKP